MNTQLWRRVAVGAAAGAVGYLAARTVRRAITVDVGWTEEDRGPRSYRRAVTIYRPPSEVYAFWRDLPNLAQVLGHVIRVDEVGDRRSRWIVEGPGGSEVDFMVEILNDEPQRVLEWRADDAPLPHAGRVEFTQAPGGRGTEVRLGVTVLAGAPSGAETGLPAGDRADRSRRDTLRYDALRHDMLRHDALLYDALLYDALRRVKQIMEAGEVVRVEGQSSGRDAIPREAAA